VNVHCLSALAVAICGVADSAKLRATALRGWAFLYTSLSAPLSTRQLEAELAALAALLHDGDVDVRAAAGEGLGLLYHSCGLGDSDFGEEEDLDDLIEEEEEEEEQQQQQQDELAPAGEQQQQVELTQIDAGGSSSSSAQQQVVLNGIPEGLVVPGTTTNPGSGGSGPRQRAVQQQQQRDGDVMSLGSSVSGLDMVIDRVRDLASNRGDRQRRSRRERQSMRSSFRELRSVMEVGGFTGYGSHGYWHVCMRTHMLAHSKGCDKWGGIEALCGFSCICCKYTCSDFIGWGPTAGCSAMYSSLNRRLAVG
jgi:hypothetical protein